MTQAVVQCEQPSCSQFEGSSLRSNLYVAGDGLDRDVPFGLVLRNSRTRLQGDQHTRRPSDSDQGPRVLTRLPSGFAMELLQFSRDIELQVWSGRGRRMRTPVFTGASDIVSLLSVSGNEHGLLAGAHSHGATSTPRARERPDGEQGKLQSSSSCQRPARSPIPRRRRLIVKLRQNIVKDTRGPEADAGRGVYVIAGVGHLYRAERPLLSTLTWNRCRTAPACLEGP